MLGPFEIAVFGLRIQTSSLLSLSRVDLATSFSVLMYSRMCIVIVRVCCILMTGKVPNHCGVGLVFHAKNMTLESLSVPVFTLSNIFYVAPVAFQAIYQIIALTNDIHYDIACFIALLVLNNP